VKAFPARSHELRVIVIDLYGMLKQCLAWPINAQFNYVHALNAISKSGDDDGGAFICNRGSFATEA
jgi:hypothetical protein